MENRLSKNKLKWFFFILLAVSAAARVLLSVFPKTALTYNDELYTLELAQNLFLRGSYTVYGVPAPFTGILYSLLLAPFYALPDALLRLKLISAFNAILISSSLIPAYLLARRILKKEWQVVFALVFAALSPNLFFSLTFMSENLYLPLLLWAFWAAHRLFAAKRKHRPALLFALFVLLLVLTGAGGLAYHPFDPAKFATSAHLMYLLYAVLLLLLFFLVSLFWFPVAIPFFSRKKLSPENRGLLYLAGGYVLVAAVCVGLKVSLPQDFKSLTPAVCLRYLLGADYPFLLLFLSLLGEKEPEQKKPEQQKKRSLRSLPPLVIGTGVFVALCLLLLFIPARKGLTDFPVLQLVTRLNPISPKHLWLCRLALIGFLVAALLLWYSQKQTAKRIMAGLLLLPLLGLELLSGVMFVRAVRREAAADPALLRQAQAIDKALDNQEGETLLVARDPEEPLLKLLNTVSSHDCRFLTGDEVFESVRALEPENRSTLSLEGITADRILTVGKWHLLDPGRNENITPAGVTSYGLYRSSDPAALALRDARSYDPGDLITFFGSHPSFRYYDAAGFTGAGPLYTWAREPEATLTLLPQLDKPTNLKVFWTWRASNGKQRVLIYANDTLVHEQTISEENRDMTFHIPAETYTDTLVLRFVFPDAREPGNGDTRLLSVAFESLTLEAE